MIELADREHGKRMLMLDPKAALDYACLAAAIVCTRAGADPPHKWEMAQKSI